MTPFQVTRENATETEDQIQDEHDTCKRCGRHGMVDMAGDGTWNVCPHCGAIELTEPQMED
jgi:ribosomal protein L37AE/L43A